VDPRFGGDLEGVGAVAAEGIERPEGPSRLRIGREDPQGEAGEGFTAQVFVVDVDVAAILASAQEEQQRHADEYRFDGRPPARVFSVPAIIL